MARSAGTEKAWKERLGVAAGMDGAAAKNKSARRSTSGVERAKDADHIVAQKPGGMLFDRLGVVSAREGLSDVSTRGGMARYLDRIGGGEARDTGVEYSSSVEVNC
jgi:hypothetical protein